MNRKVLKARTRCQSILPPSWSRRCAQCLFWAKDGETLWTRMLQMLLPGGIIANESRDVRWKSRQTCSQVLTDWQPSFCATLQTATMNLRICSHHWKGLVVDSKIIILKFQCAYNDRGLFLMNKGLQQEYTSSDYARQVSDGSIYCNLCLLICCKETFQWQILCHGRICCS